MSPFVLVEERVFDASCMLPAVTVVAPIVPVTVCAPLANVPVVERFRALKLPAPLVSASPPPVIVAVPVLSDPPVIAPVVVTGIALNENVADVVESLMLRAV